MYSIFNVISDFLGSTRAQEQGVKIRYGARRQVVKLLASLSHFNTNVLNTKQLLGLL